MDCPLLIKSFLGFKNAVSVARPKLIISFLGLQNAVSVACPGCVRGCWWRGLGTQPAVPMGAGGHFYFIVWNILKTLES